MGTAIGAAVGAKAAANPAAVSIGLKGGLAKLGNLLGFSSPWGAAAWGAVLGGNWLLSKFLRRRPKTDVTRRESTLRDESVNRRYVMGKQRRVSGKLAYASIVPPTSAAQAVKGSYKSNHFRMIFVLSEGAIGDLKGLYLDDSKYIPLTKNGNVFTPTAGYGIPNADVTKFKFPQSHVIRCLQFFDADGMAQSSIQTPVPDKRVYHNDIEYENPSALQMNHWYDFSDDSTDYYSDYFEDTNNAGQTNVPQEYQIPFYLEPKPWTNDHKLDGVSYVAVELFQPFHDSENPKDDYWKNIPKIEFIIGGLKFNTPANPTTAVESENPIDQLYWYDTEILKIPASKINLEAFNTARAICEETVSFTSAQLTPEFAGWLGTYKSFKKYMANHIIEEGEDQEGVHARLLTACAGHRFWFDGQVHYLAGKDRPSQLTLTDSELEDITEVRPWPAVSDRYNQITAEISQNRAYNYKEDTYVVSDNAARQRDGELRNLDIQLECVDHPLQAGYLLAVLNRQQRQSFTFSGVIPPLTNMDQMKKLKPGNTVTVTASEIGLDAKECIVQSIQVRADFRVLCIFKLKETGVYAETLIFPALRPRGIAFPPTIIPTAPEGLTSDEIATINKDGTVDIRLEASWDRSQNPTTEVQGRIKVAQGQTENPWLPFITTPNNTKATLENVKAGDTYEIRARHWSIDNVESPWSATIENQIDGDLTPPGDLGNFAISSLPQGIHAQWENPTDNDFAGVNVYVSEASNFNANELTLAGTLNSTVFERFGYVAGRRYFVKARPFDTSGNLGRLTVELSVVPTVQAGEGVKIFSGPNPPAQSLGQNDDLYLQLNGNLWQKQNNAWVNTGIDLTAEGAILFSFNIASTETVPRPMPDITAPVGSIAFNTANGQYWERTDATTWTYRGDLTGDKGDKGDKGSGWIPHLTNTVPSNSIGENDDYIVRPDGIWYIKINGVWVQQGDLTGSDGSKWFTYQGSAAPPSTTFNSVQANIGDFALSTNTGRYYELTGATTWTLRGDLSEVAGSKFVFFTAPIGTNPSLHITQAQANVGDEALNTTSAEMWEKTASPNTWTLRGDLGERITRITTNDPPTFVRNENW